jgi:hypothetical protein
LEPPFVSPIDAIKREVEIELDALARRIGRDAVPDVIVVRVEMNRSTGMPHAVDCHEERRRRINGGAVPPRKRCESAA